MSDHGNCNPRPLALRQEDILFRHTFLSRFAVEEERLAVLVVGRMLAEYLNETHQWGGGTDSIDGKLQAVALEVGQVAEYLAMIGRERHEVALGIGDDRLAKLAERWSGELSAFGKTIAGEVSP